MATMIRKQVYLEPGQDAEIKRLAEALDTTEADIIRKAVNLLLSEMANQLRAKTAWEEVRSLMETRATYAVADTQAEERTWTREELYEERLDRNGQGSD